MMTLTDAIRHAEECAKSCDMLADISVIGEVKERNHRCAEEHRQLAEWLKELQSIVHCNECKHCKCLALNDDSDPRGYAELWLCDEAVRCFDYEGGGYCSKGERNE